MIIQIIKKINIFLINNNTINVVIKLNKLKMKFINNFFEVKNNIYYFNFVFIFKILIFSFFITYRYIN